MEKIIQNFLTILNQLKMYHWTTDSYARHKAFGKAYDELEELVDSFVEILLAKNGKDVPSMNIRIFSESDMDITSALNDIISFLSSELPPILGEGDSDLLNIKDEMLGVVNRTKYLLTLS
jgi:hypothetical protein